MDVPVVTTPPPKILIVEDDASISRMLHSTLHAEGYDPVVVHTGEEALTRVLTEMPQLILLDLMLPGIDGFAVVNALRANARTAHIPVVILSARHDTSDKVRAFELRVDDYLTKPFNSDELLARIRTQLRHVYESLLSPLTGLPSGLRVEHAIADTLRSNAPWAILYLDFDHFKAYNDVYGPLRGNDMIRLLGHIMLEAARDWGNPEDFVGHIGGDDFIIITTPDKAETLCQQVLRRWDTESLAYYSAEDVQRGTLIANDRQGNPQVYPLITVSIGVVTNANHPITTKEEFSRVAAEVKQQAKCISGSSYFVDHRGLGHPAS